MNLTPTRRLVPLLLASSLAATALIACDDSAEHVSPDTGSWLDTGGLPDTNTNTDADTDTTAPTKLSAGAISVCFALPDSDPDARPRDFVENLNGLIVFDKPIAETSEEEFDTYCRNYASRVLQVKANDQIWSVGYKATDHAGNDITPIVDFAPDQDVALTLKQQSSWGSYFTFAARTEDGVLLTMNDGRVEALEPEAIEGLSVEVGEAGGDTDMSECGKRVGHALIFDAQSSATLDSGAQASVELDAGPAKVMNVASWSFENVQCTDTWGPNAWMAWRPSAL